jgi:hypothetical protein
MWVGTAILMPGAQALTQCQADEIAARIVQEIPGMLAGGGPGGGGGGGGGRKLHMAEHEGNHEGMEPRGGALGGTARRAGLYCQLENFTSPTTRLIVPQCDV